MMRLSTTAFGHVSMAMVIVAACGQRSSPPAGPIERSPVEPPPSPTPTSQPEPATAPSPDPSQSGIPPENSTTHIPMFPGAWRITRTISLGSAHQKTTPPATTECLTRAQMLPDPVPGMPMGARCSSSFTVQSHNLDWSFQCTVDTNTTVKARGLLRFTGKELGGTLQIEMTTTEGGSTSGSRGLLKISGEHIGDCAK